MRTTIDKAGRVVIPKALRDAVGIVPGEVDIDVTDDGGGLRLAVPCDDRLEEVDGRLVIPSYGGTITDEDVRTLLDGLRDRTIY